MRLKCSFCGSVDTRRAHRNALERLLSVFGAFPFLCVQCGARFFAWAGREEHRKRRLLRDLAAEAAAGAEELRAPEPNVLITVQTVGQTGDLLRLLEHVNASRPAPEWPAGGRVAPPPREARVLPDLSHWPDPDDD